MFTLVFYTSGSSSKPPCCAFLADVFIFSVITPALWHDSVLWTLISLRSKIQFQHNKNKQSLNPHCKILLPLSTELSRSLACCVKMDAWEVCCANTVNKQFSQSVFTSKPACYRQHTLCRQANMLKQAFWFNTEFLHRHKGHSQHVITRVVFFFL